MALTMTGSGATARIPGQSLSPDPATCEAQAASVNMLPGPVVP
jgi:hypothetical protein